MFDNTVLLHANNFSEFKYQTLDMIQQKNGASNWVTCS